MRMITCCLLLLAGCSTESFSPPRHYATIAVTEATVTVIRTRPEIPDSLHDRPRKNDKAGAPAPLQLIPPAPSSVEDIKTEAIYWDGLPLGEFVYAELGQPVQLAPVGLESPDATDSPPVIELLPLPESAPDPIHEVTARSSYCTILYFRDKSPATRAADAGAAKLVAAHWPVVAIDVEKWPEFAKQHCVVKGPMFVCLKGGIEIGRATTGDDPGAMVRQIYGLDAPRATGPPATPAAAPACPTCPNGQCPAPQQWWGRRR